MGGFLYATLGSIAAGVAVSGFRWFLIDVIWCWVFGAKKGDFKFKNLPGREDAFGFVHENHYRYYLYYANMLIASFITYGSRFFARYFEKLDLWNKRECFFLIAFLILEFILGIGAWDTRRKYYERGKAILYRKEKRNERTKNCKSEGELRKDRVFNDSHPHHL